MLNDEQFNFPLLPPYFPSYIDKLVLPESVVRLKTLKQLATVADEKHSVQTLVWRYSLCQFLWLHEMFSKDFS